VVDEELADLLLQRQRLQGGIHPVNCRVIEVERRGLEVDVELAALGACGTGGAAYGGTAH
jgi:hypothetical protein